MQGILKDSKSGFTKKSVDKGFVKKKSVRFASSVAVKVIPSVDDLKFQEEAHEKHLLVRKKLSISDNKDESEDKLMELCGWDQNAVLVGEGEQSQKQKSDYNKVIDAAAQSPTPVFRAPRRSFGTPAPKKGPVHLVPLSSSSPMRQKFRFLSVSAVRKP